MAETGASNDTKKCRFCGKFIKQEEAICPFCGYNSQTDSYDPAFKSEQGAGGKPGTKHKALDALKILLAACVIVFSVYMLGARLFAKKDPLQGLFSNLHFTFPGLMKPSTKATAGAGQKKTAAPVFKSLMKAPNALLKDDKRNHALMVEGIFFDPRGKSFATINGQVVSQGDVIGKVRVERIDIDSVAVSVNGERKVLSVSESIPLPK